jgi:hypothetical protein
MPYCGATCWLAAQQPHLIQLGLLDFVQPDKHCRYKLELVDPAARVHIHVLEIVLGHPLAQDLSVEHRLPAPPTPSHPRCTATPSTAE